MQGPKKKPRTWKRQDFLLQGSGYYGSGITDYLRLLGTSL